MRSSARQRGAVHARSSGHVAEVRCARPLRGEEGVHGAIEGARRMVLEPRARALEHGPDHVHDVVPDEHAVEPEPAR